MFLNNTAKKNKRTKAAKGLSLFFFYLLLVSCKTLYLPKNTWIGTLEPIGFTSFQYGTHQLILDDGDFIALKADSIDLDSFQGSKVKLTGEEVKGYPLDNGPRLVSVFTIKKLR